MSLTGEWAGRINVMIVRLLPAGTLMLTATRFLRVLASDVTTSALIACLIHVLGIGPATRDLPLPTEKTGQGLFLLSDLLGRGQLEHGLR